MENTLNGISDNRLVSLVATYLDNPAYLTMSEDERAKIGLPASAEARRAYIRELERTA